MPVESLSSIGAQARARCLGERYGGIPVCDVLWKRFSCKEESLERDELKHADWVWLVVSARGLARVMALDAYDLGD
ncbi:hypothetical protein CEPID_02730 [Corynebacterium epidermidicanis]|uniref:Uncharacterized protein n=1 Tax=Corynebacterium epidermidicanis TaxID=1050174 RepID=A0A0G3GMG4_9CORY|nr:hypothetical protein CEPID_02730 [Corynebacterium epidermidicanis]